MKVFVFSVLLTCLALLPACGGQTSVEEQPSVPESTPESKFDGVWEFAHLVTPDGLSTTQRGHMVVTSDHVCFVRVAKERETINTDDSDEVKAEKAAGLYNSVKATCGTFSIEGDSLKANWLTSADPSVEGNITEFILNTEPDTVSLAPAMAPQYKFVYRRVR
jgi:hypothetical protein